MNSYADRVMDLIRQIFKDTSTNYSFVAAYCGCSVSHLGKVLNGSRIPSKKLEYRLLQASYLSLHFGWKVYLGEADHRRWENCIG
jgi:hypothetical protein